jgi:hypothetical protein
VTDRKLVLTQPEAVKAASKIIKLYMDHHTNLTKVAQDMGWSRSQLVALRDRHPEIAEALAEGESMIDDGIKETLVKGGLQVEGYGKAHADAIFLSKVRPGIGYKETAVIEQGGFSAAPTVKEDDEPAHPPALSIVNLDKIAGDKSA